MRKFILGVALAMMTMMPAAAQKRGNVKNMTPEQAIEMQTSRMAKRLMLDDATTAKFAPIYKEYLTEMRACSASCAQKGTCPMDKDSVAVSDADIEKCIDQCFEMQQKKLDIKKSYYKKLKSVLNMKQMQAIFCRPAGPNRQGPCPVGNQKPGPRKQMNRTK